MGNHCLIDYIAEDHIHADITRNKEEPQERCRFGTISNRLLGGDFKESRDKNYEKVFATNPWGLKKEKQ